MSLAIDPTTKTTLELLHNLASLHEQFGNLQAADDIAAFADWVKDQDQVAVKASGSS